MKLTRSLVFDVVLGTAVLLMVFLAMYVVYPSECQRAIMGGKCCPCRSDGVSTYGWANTSQLNAQLNLSP